MGYQLSRLFQNIFIPRGYGQGVIFYHTQFLVSTASARWSGHSDYLDFQIGPRSSHPLVLYFNFFFAKIKNSFKKRTPHHSPPYGVGGGHDPQNMFDFLKRNFFVVSASRRS
jgi:hypothetical protein